MKLRSSLVAVFVTLSIVFTGCFGSFSATHALYDWNKGASSNEFVRTIILWALIIIPVYEVLLIGDFVIFNVIEFWTGKAVFADAQIERREDGSVIVYNGDDTFVFTPRDAMTLDVSLNGAPLGVASVNEAGELVFTDEDGQTRVLTPEDLERMRQPQGDTLAPAAAM